jgi:threonine dehydrogenase-like Zn-dependent dehydrogenase
MGFSGVLGHEFVGVVERVHDSTGPRGAGWVGKRVVGGINCVCGKCDMCQRGLSMHCRHRTVLGIAGRDGCFADRFTLPTANLHEVPQGVDDDRAVFAEPLAAACNILHQVRIEGRPLVTVLGDGRLGLLVAQVMAKLNATVRVVGRHESKLTLCDKWGIKHRPEAEVIPRADQDIVVDCTGSAQGLDLAMRLVRPRGRIVLKTTTFNQTGVDLSPLVIHEIQLIGSRCGPMPDALRMLAEESVDVLSLITRRFKLDQADKALAAAGHPDAVKVLIEFD